MSGPDPAVRYGLSFLAPLVATLMLTPWAARVARRLGILDRPAADRFHNEAMPYLGGAAVAAGLLLVGSFAAGASGQLATILGGGLAVGALGLIDDWRTVGPIVKLLVEGGAAVGLWLAGVRAGLFGVYPLDLALTVTWVIAVTNAVNFLDNMDGLSSGVCAIGALAFFAIAAGRGDYLVGSFALAVAGASLGFLRHNFPPARIFLGDAGSLMLGFLLAALGLKLELVGEAGLVRAAIPGLVLGVPIFDAILVVVARAREGRSVYVGGTDHSSHRMAWLGVPVRSIAVSTYAAQLASCALALWLVHASNGVALAVVIGLGAIAGIGILLFLSIPGLLAGPRDGDEPEQPARAVKAL